jgi:hypothetical protein
MYMRSLSVLMILGLLVGCQKEQDPGSGSGGNGPLSYGNSIFYLKATDYVITPVSTGAGSYSAFPDNLNIDPATGSITISVKDKEGKNTQTGLKYRIMYTSPQGKQDSTFITLAGINFQDRIYYMSNHDSIARPIYNADPSNGFPGGNFSRSNGKLDIDPSSGSINLAKSIRNGLFNDDPQNSAWRVVNIEYTSNDASESRKNNLDVVVYFYTALENIPSNVSGAMRAHQDLLIGISPATIPVTNAPVDNDIKNIVSAAKPRPPCIIIIK